MLSWTDCSYEDKAVVVQALRQELSRWEEAAKTEQRIADDLRGRSATAERRAQTAAKYRRKADVLRAALRALA